jgi:hypothetical protein
MNPKPRPPHARRALLRALLLLPLLHAATPAAAQDAPIPMEPVIGVPMAAPSGPGNLAIIALLVEDRPEIYGIGIGGPGWHLQVVGGREAGFGGRWIYGGTYDREWRVHSGGAHRLDAAAGPHLFVDRFDGGTHLRLPVALRGTLDALRGDIAVAGIGAAGAAGGASGWRGDWVEHVGVFGEAGLRVNIHGGWLQATVLADQRIFPDYVELHGSPEPRKRPRYAIRFGYDPPPRR